MDFPQQNRRFNLFGIISLIIVIFSLFVPKLFLAVILFVAITFMILGFIKDRSKVFSFISLILICIIIFSELKDTAKGIMTYSIKYQVVCTDCEATYTNETGGNTKVEKIRGSWETTITSQGDKFLYLSAQNGNGDTEVSAMIYVNDVIHEKVTSKGRFSIADVSCYPKDAK